MAKILLDKNNVVTAWQTVGGGWSDTENTIVEVDNIPEEVKENPTKYCFVDGKYEINLNYKPPEQPLSEMDEIRLALAELAEIVAGG